MVSRQMTEIRRTLNPLSLFLSNIPVFDLYSSCLRSFFLKEPYAICSIFKGKGILVFLTQLQGQAFGLLKNLQNQKCPQLITFGVRKLN